MAKSQPLLKDAALRGMKLLDIGWITIAYFAMALATVWLFNKVMGSYYDPESPLEKSKSTAWLATEVVLHIWLIGALAYVTRNLFELVPWPLEGVYGFQHLKVKEVSSSVLYVALTVTFDARLQGQVAELKRRMGFGQRFF